MAALIPMSEWLDTPQPDRWEISALMTRFFGTVIYPMVYPMVPNAET
jgi:hypothetical protein